MIQIGECEKGTVYFPSLTLNQVFSKLIEAFEVLLILRENEQLENMPSNTK